MHFKSLLVGHIHICRLELRQKPECAPVVCVPEDLPMELAHGKHCRVQCSFDSGSRAW